MAKRDEIAQQGLVILDAKGVADTRRTAERLEEAGGRILHRYGARVLIGEVPPGAGRGIAAQRGIRAVHTGPVREKPRGLTEAESLGVAAWNLRVSRRYATAKANRPADGLRWDIEGETPLIPPDGPGMTHTADEAPALGFGAALDDTSLYLIGSVAVGVIMVEGPTADLQFSDDERTKVVAEVQEGLTWLGTREPKAGVSFAYDIRPVVRLDRPPNPALSGYEPLESHWRDPAMAKIGFAANFGGVREYVKTIRANNGTKWAYVAFFTKYPTHHFAYASKPRLVMQYANDNWGPDNIDRVFTHETGHIFGCPDEYAASGCSTTTKAGFLQRGQRQLPERRRGVHAVPDGRQHLGDVQLHADPLRLARYRRRRGARPGRSGRESESAHRSQQAVRGVAVHLPAVRHRARSCGPAGGPVGVAGGVGGAGGVGAGGQPRPEAVPVELLRQVLTPAELARVEAAVRAEELRYLEALERKLRTAADAIARDRARDAMSRCRRPVRRWLIQCLGYSVGTADDRVPPSACRVTGVTLVGHDEAMLQDWVRSVDPTAQFTLDPPVAERSGHGVSVYLLEVAPRPPARGAIRPPLQLWLRYLVTTWADDPADGHRLLLDLAFAAMEQPDIEVLAEPLSAATWTALGTTAQPSFVLRASLRRDRPEAPTKPVLLPLRLDAAPRISVRGVVLDPREVALVGATVDVVGLDHTTTTDRRGQFRLDGLPGAPVKTRLRVRAKGVEVIVPVPAKSDLASSMVIHLDPLEGEHGRTAHA